MYHVTYTSEQKEERLSKDFVPDSFKTTSRLKFWILESSEALILILIAGRWSAYHRSKCGLRPRSSNFVDVDVEGEGVEEEGEGDEAVMVWTTVMTTSLAC